MLPTTTMRRLLVVFAILLLLPAVAAAEPLETDLGTRLASDLYVLMAEVELPDGVDADAVTSDLRAAAAAVGVTVAFEPVDDEVL